MNNIGDIEYDTLNLALKAGLVRVIARIDDPFPTSHDQRCVAAYRIAHGQRIVEWEAAGPSVGVQSRLVSRERVLELLRNGATWFGDDADQPGVGESCESEE